MLVAEIKSVSDSNLNADSEYNPQNKGKHCSFKCQSMTTKLMQLNSHNDLKTSGNLIINLYR